MRIHNPVPVRSAMQPQSMLSPLFFPLSSMCKYTIRPKKKYESHFRTCLSPRYLKRLLLALFIDRNVAEKFIAYAINGSHPNLDEIGRRVLECQSSLLLGDVEPSQDAIERGFLIHQWSLASLKEFLLPATSLLLCLIDKNEQKLAGYQVLTSINVFLHYLDPTVGEFELIPDTITHEEWSKLISVVDMRYLEQTGVAPDYQRQGVATYLTQMAKTLSSAGLCTFVLDWPYSNRPSYHFKLRNGFRCIGLWKGDTGTKIGSIKSKLFVWQPS